MNTKDLYFGRTRKVMIEPQNNKNEQIEDFTSLQDYTIFQYKNGKYRDVRQLLGGYYKMTYETIGDKFIDKLIPYRQKELKAIKKDLLEEVDTSKFFVGYRCCVVSSSFATAVTKK